jgi:hypothetical protein
LPVAEAQDFDADAFGPAEVGAEPFVEEAPSSNLMLNAEPVAPGESYQGGMGYDSEPIAPVRPVNWISGPYLRGGVNFVLNDEIFDVEQGTGYSVIGGYRQPLGPEIGGDRFFFDLGGSYQHSYGEATPLLIQGLRTTVVTQLAPLTPRTDTISAFVPNSFEVTLQEMRRASAHAAIGWFWGPGADDRRLDTQLRFATRIGGRVGHARAGVDETRLQFANADDEDPPVISRETLDPVFYRQTDTYGGLFVGTEAILLQRQYSFGHFQWSVDGEYANDWINMDVWEGSLGTASVTMGFMLSR